MAGLTLEDTVAMNPLQMNDGRPVYMQLGVLPETETPYGHLQYERTEAKGPCPSTSIERCELLNVDIEPMRILSHLADRFQGSYGRICGRQCRSSWS